jgi:SulP family sulfate permease
MLTAWHMVDWHGLAYHVRATRFDAAIVAVTAVSAVVISVEFCVLVGVFMSALLTVPRAGRMLRSEFVVTSQSGIHERLPDDAVCGHVLIFGLEGELFFGAAAALDAHLEYIESRILDQTRAVVLRMKRLRNADASGLLQLAGFFERLGARGVHVIVCGVHPGMHRTMIKTGLVARLRDDEVFLEQPVRQTSTFLAVRHAYTLVSEPCPICPRRENIAPDGGLYDKA